MHKQRTQHPYGEIGLTLVMILSALFFALLTPKALGAPQDQGVADEAQAPNVAEAPTPELDLSELTGRVESVGASIDNYRPLLEPVDNEQLLSAQLDELGALLDRAEEELNESEGDLLSNRESEAAVRARHLANRIRATDDELATRLDAVLTGLEELNTSENQWREVQATLDSQGLSDDLSDRISVAREAIDQFVTELRQRRDEILNLRNAVAQQWVRAEQIVEQIDAWRSTQFLVRTRTPLWQVKEAWLEARGEDHLPFLSRLHRRIQVATQFFADTAEDYLPYLPIFLLLLIISYSLGRHAHKRQQTNDRLARAAAILSRPVSISLLLLVIVLPTAGWPNAARQILILLVALPFYRVLMAILPERSRWTIIPLIALLLLHVIRNLLGDGGVPDRWLSVLISAGLGAILWFSLRRQSQLIDRTDTPNRAWAQLPMWALFVISILAALGELAGYVNASTPLSQGLTTGVYMAFVCYAAYRFLSGITSVLLFSDRAKVVRAVYRHRVALQEFFWRVFAAGSYLLWLYLTLDRFQIAENLLDPLSALMGATLEVGSLSVSLGGIVAFVLTLWVSFLLARAIPALLEEDVFARMHLKRGVPYAISTFTRYVLVVVGLIAAVSAAGVDLSQTLIVFGALGVGIGFGLQNVVNDFVAGGILLFERPIQVGDIIQLGTLGGRVSRIGARSSTIETWDGAEVIIPNGQLTATQLTNWTLSHRRRRIDIEITVGHEADARQVVEILNQVASQQEGIAPEPPPQALFLRFGESGSVYRLMAWTNEASEFMGLQSELNAKISAELKARGIRIPVLMEGLRHDPAASY